MIDIKETIVVISSINSNIGIIMLNDIALFVHIVKTGNLSQAAKLQALPAATVTRRLQKLEHKLKCKLINRSARQFNLTAEGQKLFDECSYLVESLEDRTHQFESSVNELSGKIKLLAPTNLAIGPLSDALITFISEYEEIDFEFIFDNKRDDFLTTQADFAIRVGPQPSSELYQVRIGSIKTIIVASKEYLKKHEKPAIVNDLDSHHLIVASSLNNWSLNNTQHVEKFNFKPSKPRVVANELRLVKQLTIEGLGISLLPVSEVVSEINSGQLIQVLPMWTGQDRDIYIIWANGKLLTRRAKLFIEHLKSFVANVACLQGEIPENKVIPTV